MADEAETYKRYQKFGFHRDFWYLRDVEVVMVKMLQCYLWDPGLFINVDEWSMAKLFQCYL
jgi:hypothetical protein